MEDMFMAHQNTGQNHSSKIGNKYFENVAKFRHLETTVTI